MIGSKNIQALLGERMVLVLVVFLHRMSQIMSKILQGDKITNTFRSLRIESVSYIFKP